MANPQVKHIKLGGVERVPNTNVQSQLEKRITKFRHASQYITKHSCLQDMKVIRRIGTLSLAGEAYLTKVGGMQTVTKVLPIVSDKTNNDNQNEIEIAEYASDQVIRGRVKHFPLVYGNARCLHTYYDRKSIYRVPSYDYQLYKLAIQNMSSKAMKKRTEMLFRNMDTEQRLEYLRNHGIKVPEDLPIPSDILVSEVAWGDLYYFLNKYKLNNRELYKLYIGIINVVMDMQNIGIQHNDFHSGNILLLGGPKGLLLLAHDFGRSRITNIKNSEFYSYDIYTITGKLLEQHFPNNPQLLQMYRMISSTAKSADSSFLDKVRTYWRDVW